MTYSEIYALTYKFSVQKMSGLTKDDCETVREPVVVTLKNNKIKFRYKLQLRAIKAEKTRISSKGDVQLTRSNTQL